MHKTTSISTAKHRIQTLTLPLSISRRLCTAAAAAAETAEYKPLYRRLAAVRGDPKGSVEATMEGWLKEGKKVTRADAIVFVKGLRRFKDHKNSFALIDWMEKRGMHINVSIQAIHLDLISKAKGISEAKEFFSNLPESGKAQKNYAALLTNYCQEKSISKALSLYKKMQELNLASTSLISNNIMTLYSKLGQPEKVIAHFQAMKAENISPDRVTYGLLVNSFGVLNDINAAERVFEEMKENGQVVPDWTYILVWLTFITHQATLRYHNLLLKRPRKL